MTARFDPIPGFAAALRAIYLCPAHLLPADIVRDAGRLLDRLGFRAQSPEASAIEARLRELLRCTATEAAEHATAALGGQP